MADVSAEPLTREERDGIKDGCAESLCDGSCVLNRYEATVQAVEAGRDEAVACLEQRDQMIDVLTRAACDAEAARDTFREERDECRLALSVTAAERDALARRVEHVQEVLAGLKATPGCCDQCDAIISLRLTLAADDQAAGGGA